MAAPGAWASALGAAILGGNQAYQSTAQRDFENKRQKEQDLRAQQMQDAQMQIMALQRAIAQHTVTDLPKKDAAADAESIYKLSPEDAFNNPAFVDARAKAGTPLQTNPILGNQNLDSILSMISDKPGQLRENAAGAAGVSPKTGALIPPEIQFAKTEREKKALQDDISMKALIDAFGDPRANAQPPAGLAPPNAAPPPGLAPPPAPPTGNAPPSPTSAAANRPPPGFEKDENGVPIDSMLNRQRGALLGPLNPMEKIHGPASDSPAVVKAKTIAAEEAKTVTPPAVISKVTGEMDAMVTNLQRAQKALEGLYPGIQEVIDPATGEPKTDGRGTYNGAGDLAKAKAMRTAYNFMYTPYNKAIQAASLGNVQGWATLVPGRMNMAILQKATEHQSAFGNETPLATYTRNQELIDMIKQNRAQFQAASAPVNKRTGQPVAALPAAVATVPPPAAGNTSALAGGLQVKKGGTIEYGDMLKLLKPGEDPVKFAAQLQAEGVKVLKMPGDNFTTASPPAWKEQPQPWSSPEEDIPQGGPNVGANEPPPAVAAAVPPPGRSGPYPPPTSPMVETPAPNVDTLQKEIEQVKRDYADHGHKVEWVKGKLKWFLDQLTQQVVHPR